MQNVYVSTRKGLFRYDPQSKALDLIGFRGDPVTAALKDPRDGTLYAALNLGHFGCKLHRSTDDGAHWEEVAVPAYPRAEGQGAPAGKSAGAGDGEERGGAPGNNGKSLRQVWCLETGGPEEAGVLWAGTIPGGLFRSADRGESWQLVESLWNRPERKEWFGGGYDEAGIHSVCVHPRDPKRITVGISCGGVWHTEDGGNSWTLAAKGMEADFMPPDKRGYENNQDPHVLSRCLSHPEVLWCQHHCTMYRSEDGGRTWVEIEGKPSKFGFAVAAHPNDPDTAWFVPAVKDECRIPVDGQMVVSRTRDGGKSFEVLREGLPQENAYDLVYRHALDVDAEGKCLAMGSTTGGFWYSDNGGDAWRLVNAHMPPVYAVRIS